jgi:hypothetical protein
MRSSPHTLHKKHTTVDLRKKSLRHRDAHTSLQQDKKYSSQIERRIKRSLKLVLKSILLSRSFHSVSKMSATALIVVPMLYGSYIYIGKTFANEVIVSQSEIIARVAKLTSLPQEEPYEIVRVQDQDDLRKQNPFYKDVKEGDYIIMYKNAAIIYDLRNNAIVAMKRD